MTSSVYHLLSGGFSGGNAPFGLHPKDKERAQAFDAEFIRLARSVYFENDERAVIKRRINEKLGSSIIEEKSYRDYKAPR